MMGMPQTPSPPSYPQAIQIKLYQAFIFSIPILFSVILLLLFYLFYLKRRASNASSPSSILPTTTSNASAAPSDMGSKGNLKDKLPIIMFDEDLQAKDSQCCVCLGEFEMKEELHQVPSCRHVFHVDCIRLWLHSNSTCPLCRCPIIATSKQGLVEPLATLQDTENINRSPQNVPQSQPEQVVNIAREEESLQLEGSSSTSSTTSSCSHCQMGNNSIQDSLVLRIGC